MSKPEEELIITKLNRLYKIIGDEKFCLYSDIFMSAIEEYKSNKQEIKINDLLILLELSIEKFNCNFRF